MQLFKAAAMQKAEAIQLETARSSPVLCISVLTWVVCLLGEGGNVLLDSVVHIGDVTRVSSRPCAWNKSSPNNFGVSL